jgi:hypothetical protein
MAEEITLTFAARRRQKVDVLTCFLKSKITRSGCSCVETRNFWKTPGNHSATILMYEEGAVGKDELKRRSQSLLALRREVPVDIATSDYRIPQIVSG